MRRIGMALAGAAVLSGSMATAQTAAAAQSSHDTNVYTRLSGRRRRCSTAAEPSGAWAADPAGSGATAGASGPVGADGTMVSGMSPDGSKAVTVLSFTQGGRGILWRPVEFDRCHRDPRLAGRLVCPPPTTRH